MFEYLFEIIFKSIFNNQVPAHNAHNGKYKIEQNFEPYDNL